MVTVMIRLSLLSVVQQTPPLVELCGFLKSYLPNNLVQAFTVLIISHLNQMTLELS